MESNANATTIPSLCRRGMTVVVVDRQGRSVGRSVGHAPVDARVVTTHDSSLVPSPYSSLRPYSSIVLDPTPPPGTPCAVETYPPSSDVVTRPPSRAQTPDRRRCVRSFNHRRSRSRSVTHDVRERSRECLRTSRVR